MILCHRCGEPVEKSAEFCAQCGAPQLYLAVDDEPSAGDMAVGAAAARAGMVDWPLALEYAAGVTAVGLLLFMAAAWVPFVAVLGFVLVLSCGQLVVDLYRRKRPAMRMDGAVGARIGAATGVLMGAAKVAALAVSGWVERYGLHHGAAMDAEFAQSMGTVQQMMVKMMGQPLPAEQVRWMLSPEYHAAVVLADVAMGWVLILLVATGAGALVGFLQGRRRIAGQ